jgi:hypothetical protein
MQVEDFDKFHEGVAGVMGFYGKTLSSFALDIWWSALKAYDLPTIVTAFNRHVTNPDAGQFPPKPADLIRMLQGSTQDAAMRAWAKVDRALREKGTYVDVVFDDPLIHRVIHDMGGWIAIGYKTEDEWPFVAREFENRYRGFKGRNEQPDYPAKLIGLTSAHNARKGFPCEPAVLIGDEVTARQVLKGGSDHPTMGFKRMQIDPGELANEQSEREQADKGNNVKLQRHN